MTGSSNFTPNDPFPQVPGKVTSGGTFTGTARPGAVPRRFQDVEVNASVRIAIDGGQQTVHGPYAAAMLLMISWPTKSGPQRDRAAPLLGSNTDQEGLEPARDAFVAAAAEADLGADASSGLTSGLNSRRSWLHICLFKVSAQEHHRCCVDRTCSSCSLGARGAENMTTPLGRVRGLGSAKSGTRTYWTKQFSGVLLAVLTPYIVIIAVMTFGRPWPEAQRTLSSLWVAPFVVMFLVVSATHMRIGMQVIIEDYIHRRTVKWGLLAANWMFTWGIVSVALIALLKIVAFPYR